MTESLSISYTKISGKVQVPVYQTPFSAGADIIAAVDLKLVPGEVGLVQTGLQFAIPVGYEAQVRPRSGLSLKTSLRIANSPGTIDADYRGELGIIVENTFSQADLPLLLSSRRQLTTQFLESAVRSTWREFALASAKHLLVLPDEMLNQVCWLDQNGDLFGTINIKAGERIAQLIIAKVVQAEFSVCDDVSQLGTNRGGGFGSTGRF